MRIEQRIRRELPRRPSRTRAPHVALADPAGAHWRVELVTRATFDLVHHGAPGHAGYAVPSGVSTSASSGRWPADGFRMTNTRTLPSTLDDLRELGHIQ